MSAHETPVLHRFAYLPECTLGWLVIGGEKLATVERPWMPHGSRPGGTPNESCVPDGRYALRNHHSTRFPETFALTAPSSGVWYMPADRPGKWGRTAILIHVGNTVDDVAGCIAVGLTHAVVGEQRFVGHSRQAMDILRKVWEPLPEALIIRPTTGTAELDWRR